MKNLKIDNETHRKVKVEAAKRGVTMIQLLNLAVETLTGGKNNGKLNRQKVRQVGGHLSGPEEKQV